MNQILLVEGKDDLHVFSNIFKKHNVLQSFNIKDKEGIDAIYKSIPIYLKADNSTIGVIVDADTDIKSKWQTLKSVLSEKGYDLPSKPMKEGTIIRKEYLPAFGIWIMPNNDENGMLEDFVNYLIPAGDKIMPFVESSLRLLETKQIAKYKLIHKSKAKIHTWLAWQETPGVPMGVAINKTYLDSNHKICIRFVNWINELYNEYPSKKN
ncbi:MAG: hypothetical protein B6D64_07095 [Bacteroidetes bacterium 4484_276]|nr:MAG: hypothetical protein B6D64_07095 [Bacteroidetes bacterium 4484_276]